jgi:hypothetical protein
MVHNKFKHLMLDRKSLVKNMHFEEFGEVKLEDFSF